MRECVGSNNILSKTNWHNCRTAASWQKCAYAEQKKSRFFDADMIAETLWNISRSWNMEILSTDILSGCVWCILLILFVPHNSSRVSGNAGCHLFFIATWRSIIVKRKLGTLSCAYFGRYDNRRKRGLDQVQVLYWSLHQFEIIFSNNRALKY